MGVGGGFVSTKAVIEGGTHDGNVTAAGPAFSFDLAIGGAIKPGLILAGAYSVYAVGDAKLTNDTRRAPVAHDTQLTLLSAMIDLYPNPKEGFHFGGGLGVATVRLRAAENAGDDLGIQTGVGITPHVGYEWWVGNYWGMGILGRFVYARSRGSYSGGTETDNHVGAAVLFSATYN